MKTMRSLRSKNLFVILIATLILAACNGAPVDDALNTEPPATTISIDAGANINAASNQKILLQANISGGSVASPQFTWQQTAGPVVTFINDQQTNLANPQFITPSVGAEQELIFAVTLNENNKTYTDEVSVFVSPCQTTENSIFENCLAPNFGPFVAFEAAPDSDSIFQYEGEGDFHVNWKVIDTAEQNHNQVIEATWNANDPNHQSDAKGWFGIETQIPNLNAYAQGSLSFDMRVIYHEMPDQAAPFIVKMECGYPCLSDEFIIANAQNSYEWKTYTYPISQFIATGLDIQKVSLAFVVQPAWQQQEQTVTVQFDNIKLSKTYEAPTQGQDCPAAGNVTYNLARAANPTADQQEAYNLITSAMDDAVKNYNCYTNLVRALNVSYNPSVATADGSTNGSIRFGSRASMHKVTAMHEVAHVFGVGANPFKALVVNGVFTGAAATAQLRQISGISDDEIHTDGTHFWPHGLNYISEGETQQDLINHCLVVEAIVRDLQ